MTDPTTGAEIRDALARHVQTLAGAIGERNVWRYESLQQAEKYITETLVGFGYAVQRQEFQAKEKVVANLECQIDGSDEIVVIGAHYDSNRGTPGANDNASGVAATLELARMFVKKKAGRTLRFVAFVNEEPPFFHTELMGSLVYARRCRQRGEKIVAMLTPETIGCYSDQAGSQKYPIPLNLFYPNVGDFIAFVGNGDSRALVRQIAKSFGRHTDFPFKAVALPNFLRGIGWSDHWSFWQEGYPGVMATDTAPYRYKHYHKPTDTPEKLDYERMAKLVMGLEKVVEELAA
jgi:Zn-dependent M28 family amino/carboxypeptidase